MNVKEIIAAYLKANGYGGLHNDECGCFDDDLIPCGECCDECEPAYKVPVHCNTCNAACDSRGEGGIKFCLTTEKPKRSATIMSIIINNKRKALLCVQLKTR